jgi:hypothetical protein
MRFWLARIVRVYACFQLGCRQQPFRFDDCPLAVHPLGLDRVEPRALTRQQAGDKADALSLRLDEAVVRPYPVAYLLAFVPRGIVPDQQQGLFAQCREFVAAPREKLRGELTNRLAYGKAQPDLFRSGWRGPQQQAIAGQRLGVGIVRGQSFLDEPQASSRRHPAVELGLSQAAPPDLIFKSQHPRWLVGRQADQAVALFFFRT